MLDNENRSTEEQKKKLGKFTVLPMIRKITKNGIIIDQSYRDLKHSDKKKMWNDEDRGRNLDSPATQERW